MMKIVSVEDAVAEWRRDEWYGADGVEARLQSLRDACTRRLLQRLATDQTELLAHLWEQLHSYYWKDVPLVYRELYALASYAAVLRELAQHGGGVSAEALRKADMGILLGSPCVARSRLQDLAQQVHDELTSDLAGESAKRRKTASDDDAAQLPNATDNSTATATATAAAVAAHSLPPNSLHPTTAIPRVHQLPLAHFSSLYFDRAPVIISGMMEHWPAMEAWSSLARITERIGHRTVPVETGRTYLDAGAGTRLMTVSAFVDTCILRPEAGAEGGYLAQHRLLDQIPSLARDFDVPDYTVLSSPSPSASSSSSSSSSSSASASASSDSPADPAPQDVATNVWLGPCNTISPLHFDCSHNLLAQVCGHKYVRLYAPAHTASLYPHTGRMKNNSRVDLLRVDAQAFPLVSAAPFADAVLAPGEMLYIPKGHWHFVQACRGRPGDYCFSVSFWWDRSELGGVEEEEGEEEGEDEGEVTEH